MIELIALHAVLGFIVGFRYRIFILIPLVAASCLEALLLGLRLGFFEGLIILIGTVTALQLGYLAGAFGSEALRQTRPDSDGGSSHRESPNGRSEDERLGLLLLEKIEPPGRNPP
jgi:hypothetical protein